jgi:hypothetical protein
MAPLGVTHVPQDGNQNVHTFNFTPPPGHSGWGYYTINVQCVVGNSSQEFESDWWPRLTIH